MKECRRADEEGQRRGGGLNRLIGQKKSGECRQQER